MKERVIHSPALFMSHLKCLLDIQVEEWGEMSPEKNGKRNQQ